MKKSQLVVLIVAITASSTALAQDNQREKMRAELTKLVQVVCVQGATVAVKAMKEEGLVEQHWNTKLEAEISIQHFDAKIRDVCSRMKVEDVK